MNRPVEKHHLLYEPLVAIVGPKYVSDEDFTLWSYSQDSGPFPGKIPGIVVRPGTTEEISEILRLANRTNTPVVPRGGAASLFGLPHGEPGRNIVLDLTRMDEILNIDEENLTVTAQCGITMSKLGTLLEERGLFAHLMLMPYYSDTLGGALAGVVGGGWPLDFAQAGSNWRYVLGLKVVLPNGSIIQTGGGPGTNLFQKVTFFREGGSPDVTGLFIGDGGIFGVKTEATLQIWPLPEVTRAGSFLFESFEDLWQALGKGIQSKNPLPYNFLAAFDPECMTLLSQGKVNKWGLLYATKGPSEKEVIPRGEVIQKICSQAGGKAGPEILNQIITEEGGRAVLSNMGNFVSLGEWVFLESIVPKKDFPCHYLKCRSFIRRRFEEEGLEAYGAICFDMILTCLQNAGFSGTNISYPDHIPEAREKVLKIAKEYYEFAVREGGFLWGHQGYGTEVLASFWSPTFYEFMLTLKRAIDPKNILNPGLWRL